MGQEEASFTVVFVTDKAIHDYNLRYRHMDKPTDVLSFMGEDGYLGDIVISWPTVQRQAREAGHDAIYELLYLTAHGTLHLIGYDDSSEAGYAAMVQIQERVLQIMGQKAQL